ncbi:hypothetical protein EHH44_02460 [Mycolicibacter terrae]|uniref:Lipoprotein LppI n=2 Tax=Mycolicibacter TaxID=1073531 RepID=A0A1A2Y6Y8_MYCSD|nr:MULTISPECIES: hypothetical protein [Mycolicibacter]OBH20252.1 hypothetical protein A5694_16850 [Mycolicibacter sinensis]OBI33188.1 hypothetical protein A5710_01660 [Mycolicibacter sinensis]RRR48237.1 hypothetical protein EHH44_02460 [Mycolicibacter terrae]
MRLAGLIAVLLLIAGCSRATVGEPEPSATGPSSPATTTGASSVPASPTSSSSVPSAPPAPGAAIAEVIAWIEAGRPVDAAGYHSATRDGVTTDLVDEVAFTVPAAPHRATNCMTDSGSADGALACVVDLVNPPAQPAEIYGQWKGGWVDYGGNTLQVGSAHGDPGRFVHGDGAELPDGSTLSFGDYRCRADRAGLFCVNYAHRSAVRFSPEDIAVFGCLRPVPPPADAGKLFSCAS